MRVNYVLYPSLALIIFSNKENVNLVMSFNICWGIKFQPSSETGATTQHRSWVSVPISHQLVQSLLPAQTRSNFRWKLKINWMARRTLNFFQFVGGRIFMMIGIQKFYPRFSLKATKSPQTFAPRSKFNFRSKFDSEENNSKFSQRD